ncbi:hypothetical protein E1B28_011690 [Marasmius oreades]|uniref:Uncharacterized protein n=1 Tax=Marasmius oreades TaxID=181124 RepID=A0A9P7RW13_9AGAR|nr:uncharacterized protein E1B28_011690 [Marasmius oreades]KAG7090073.1 hypothetical protein E1B28_011690 [Marasmius oreades]
MSKPNTTYVFTFPPFPVTPEGVSVTPFVDFQQRGIQIHLLGDEGEELDGIGNPTVALNIKHNTDTCKTDAKPRTAKVYKAAVKKLDGTMTVRKKEWWEEWEEIDRIRGVIGYNPNEARSDRFHKAVGDFNRNRRWPPMTTRVREQWDQFQLFAGLLTSIPIWQKKRANNPDDAETSESESDVENDDDEDGSSKLRHIEVHKVDTSLNSESEDKSLNRPKYKRPRPREPYGKGPSDLGCRPTVVENDEQIRELLSRAKEEKEDKLVAFLNDPERGVKVYLSSYFRRQGFHYTDRNLFTHPKLICIFLSYILRHHVLPDKEEEAAIRKAKEVTELALQELPLTSKLAKAIPDDFNRALSVFFEIRKERNFWANPDVIDSEKQAEDAKQTQESSKEKRDQVTRPEPNAKRVKLDTENDGYHEENAESSFLKEVIREGKLEILDGATKTGLRDAVATEGDVQMVDVIQEKGAAGSTLHSSSWGTSDSGGWGDAASTGQWANTTNDTTVLDVWGEDSDPWGAAGDSNEPLWSSADPTLLPLLGPTTLPMTHRTGMVEWSVRRVKKVIPPDLSTVSIPVQPTEVIACDEQYGNPYAVESELSRKLYRVEMEPWLGWGDSSQEEEGVLPRILEASRGQVIVQRGVVFEGAAKEKVGVARRRDEGMDVDSPSVYTSSSGIRPFNALEDTITVLMESSSVEHLRVGMGLGGTWVQLLRNGDIEGDSGLIGKSKKKGKCSSGERFWYVDELMVTLTSYHTV